MSKPLVMCALLVFSLHSVVAAQNPHVPTVNGRSSASSASAASTGAANRIRSMRSTQMRLANRAYRSLGETMSRGKNELFRTSNERIQGESHERVRRQLQNPSTPKNVFNLVRIPGTRTDRAFSKRLAEIDKIRDMALATGNVGLLDQADAMEKSAQYEICGWEESNLKKPSLPQFMPGPGQR